MHAQSHRYVIFFLVIQLQTFEDLSIKTNKQKTHVKHEISGLQNESGIHQVNLL